MYEDTHILNAKNCDVLDPNTPFLTRSCLREKIDELSLGQLPPLLKSITPKEFISPEIEDSVEL